MEIIIQMYFKSANMEHRYCLSQLKQFVYSYFLYDNANLPYAVAMTWLYYVCLSFYYVL